MVSTGCAPWLTSETPSKVSLGVTCCYFYPSPQDARSCPLRGRGVGVRGTGACTGPNPLTPNPSPPSAGGRGESTTAGTRARPRSPKTSGALENRGGLCDARGRFPRPPQSAGMPDPPVSLLERPRPGAAPAG